MRWEISICGNAVDITRLAGEELPRLTPDLDDPNQLTLTLVDPEGAAVTDEVAHAAKARIDAAVRNINGVGRLRWGRAYGGVSVRAIRSFDAEGNATQRVYGGTAYDHLLPEEYADLVERLGHRRPEPPVGWDEIKALDLARLTELAEDHPEVGRVLHLVDLMLLGDEEIDWVVANAALEIIAQNLKNRGLRGQDLPAGAAEVRRFRATANSPEVLGVRARHGKDSGVQQARMNATEASWLVRRAAARWMADLLASA